MPLGRGNEMATPVHLLSPEGWHQATLGETQHVAHDCRWIFTRGRELLKTTARTSPLSPALPAIPSTISSSAHLSRVPGR